MSARYVPSISFEPVNIKAPFSRDILFFVLTDNCSNDLEIVVPLTSQITSVLMRHLLKFKSFGFSAHKFSKTAFHWMFEKQKACMDNLRANFSLKVIHEFYLIHAPMRTRLNRLSGLKSH